MNAYAEAAKLMAQVQKAGARHSSKDNSLIQQLHDLSCELGAECPMKDMAIHPQFKAAVEALVLRHPGHGNQKVHGNRFGGYGTTKESLRRLKDDKGARERYKESARKRGAKAGGSNSEKIDTDAIASISSRRGSEYSEALSDLDRLSPKKDKKGYEQAKQKVQMYGDFLGSVQRITSNKSLTPAQQKRYISDLNNELLDNLAKRR